MDKGICFRDLLAVAVVKSRYDCKLELDVLQERVTFLETALQKSDEERNCLLVALGKFQHREEEHKASMRNAEISLDMMTDLRRENDFLRQELDKQPVGSESIDFRQMALEGFANLSESRESEMRRDSSSEVEGGLHCTARVKAILQSMSVLHYRCGTLANDTE